MTNSFSEQGLTSSAVHKDIDRECESRSERWKVRNQTIFWQKWRQNCLIRINTLQQNGNTRSAVRAEKSGNSALCARHPFAPITDRGDDGGDGTPAPTAGQADHAGKHPRVNIQAGFIQPRRRNVLGTQLPGSAAGACDVEIVLTDHA